jgi:hypothetical protein
MAEGVLEPTIPIAPEHVGHRHGDFRSSGDRARGERVDVVDIEMDEDSGALERPAFAKPPECCA